MVKLKDTLLVLILFSFGIFFIYLYFYIENTQNEIKDKIIENKIRHMSNTFSHIEYDILKIYKNDDIAKSLADKKLRSVLESKLRILLSKNKKYVYFLYLDKNKKFRFLLDGSFDDKARFYQKFDPINKNIYFKVYATKEKKIIFHKNLENLWITLLYPVKQNDKVIGILSMDMTTSIQDDIAYLIEPLKNFFVILIVFTFLFISVTTIQLFRYFRTRKRLFHDQLTNLFNRNYLEEIQGGLNLEHYSLAMLDLDRFKIINDTYGHATGDFVLQDSARIFKENIRDSDILIRFGGEEFLLFISTNGKKDSALKVCDRIRENISNNNIKYEDSEISMTVSIGLVEFPSRETNLLDAIKKVDSMLYLAKQRGRDQIVRYNSNTENTSSINKKGVSDVKTALNEDRVICHFQPIVNAKDLTILKYEALVRITSVTGETIYPGDFLPYIKHTNIHYKLTKKILEICFDKFKNSDKLVSINVSFLDLLNRDIVSFISKTLLEDPALASRITFEILESDEIEDINIFTQKIDLLHKLGSKIAIDDFGSGYSNFKAVLDVRADYLKIDGTLIKEIDNDQKVFQVVKSIVSFARDSGMKTVAEFVASKEIYEKLKTLDIDYMQGFYLAKPNEKIIEEIKI